ncbi:hypothetical protein H4696_001072 [Amycolatopsis lexingtonensis]|uniref:Uncharacterized protein n=1 Tax=Amycolatopsis lexingtonensis TaxID=218822 RepID=A0ABR9HT83_9PSEU|nr:hypothetical protein [Amycolatopsis lexingtonensis]
MTDDLLVTDDIVISQAADPVLEAHDLVWPELAEKEQ